VDHSLPQSCDTRMSTVKTMFLETEIPRLLTHPIEGFSWYLKEENDQW
jgi:hypothetical protein